MEDSFKCCALILTKRIFGNRDVTSIRITPVFTLKRTFFPLNDVIVHKELAGSKTKQFRFAFCGMTCVPRAWSCSVLKTHPFLSDKGKVICNTTLEYMFMTRKYSWKAKWK